MPKTLSDSKRRAVILMYHRINELRPDPWTLCVSPANFAAHLQVIRELAAPCSLAKISIDSAGKMPLAITFDDGYADNFEAARPLLEQFEIPATIFVTAGRISSEREFWWDELERILLQPNELPAALEIKIGDDLYRHSLGANRNYSFEEAARDRNWNCIGDDNAPTARHRIYRELFDLIRLRPTVEQSQILSELFAWANLTECGARIDRRMMTAAELIATARGDFIEIGAHTLTHPVLSTLQPDAQFAEIAGGKRVLEQIINQPVRSFAYPNGFPTDYTAETVTAARQAGFELACAAFDAEITRATNRFELPRAMVRDWDGATFRRILTSYVDAF